MVWDKKRFRGGVMQRSFKQDKNLGEKYVILDIEEDKAQPYMWRSKYANGSTSYLDSAQFFGTVKEAENFLNLSYGTIVQLKEITRTVYRCNDTSVIMESLAPLGYGCSADWKATEAAAKKAAIKRLKKKMVNLEKKFTADIAKLNYYLQRIEPNSVVFMRDLMKESLDGTSPETEDGS